ncbi:uncharacterized protein LOC111408144 [Olea europaea var. sylvestris]|uniref:uncharacterized protein LOC111408144 n=1 Tax=Olea europaea var. sylvestris TaxID=158386 RepID=UPI000C1D71F3|nr:uncharacterized protein LOC111408144 [Olea europaea var. sylvestris]
MKEKLRSSPSLFGLLSLFPNSRLLALFSSRKPQKLHFQHYSSDSSFHQSAYDSNKVTLHGGSDKYFDANTVKFPLSSSIVMKDEGGWLINPVSLALDAAITGGASFCASIHLGEIRRRGVRENHRHHTCNETFVIWGAKTLFK